MDFKDSLLKLLNVNSPLEQKKINEEQVKSCIN